MLKKIILNITLIMLAQTIGFAEEIQIPFGRPADLPYFSTPQLSFDTQEFNTLILNISAQESGTARLFWANTYDPQFNTQKSIWFYLKKGEHNYYFNIPSRSEAWFGYLLGFLLYPDMDPTRVEIKDARISSGGILTTTLSGWQEFWGPNGREVIGSTINTIKSSNLFGRSIFVYLYWIIGLLAIGILAWETKPWFSLKKKPPFNVVLSKSGKTIFIFLTVFWCLLEASSLYNNWLGLKSDWKYVGKSYREKLILANSGDFYPFIQFCENNLPSQAGFDMRIPPLYNDIKARYYLYPRQMTTTEAEYLVVYDQPVEPLIAAQYQVFKTFREKAYIMKKR